MQICVRDTRGGGSWYFRPRSREELANFIPIAGMGHLMSEPKGFGHRNFSNVLGNFTREKKKRNKQFYNMSILLQPKYSDSTWLTFKARITIWKGFWAWCGSFWYDRDRDACCKINSKPMKETNLGMAQAPKRVLKQEATHSWTNSQILTSKSTRIS